MTPQTQFPPDDISSLFDNLKYDDLTRYPPLFYNTFDYQYDADHDFGSYPGLLSFASNGALKQSDTLEGLTSELFSGDTNTTSTSRPRRTASDVLITSSDSQYSDAQDAIRSRYKPPSTVDPRTLAPTAPATPVKGLAELKPDDLFDEVSKCLQDMAATASPLSQLQDLPVTFGQYQAYATTPGLSSTSSSSNPSPSWSLRSPIPNFDLPMLLDTSTSPPSIASSELLSISSLPTPASSSTFDSEDDEYLPSATPRKRQKLFDASLTSPQPKRRKLLPNSPLSLPSLTPSVRKSLSSNAPSRRARSASGSASASAPPCTGSSPAPRRTKFGRPTKTNLEKVLDSLPYTMADILREGKDYLCPFPGCPQRTTSEGDLGRHLESRAHATHTYMCFGCLGTFARDDSLQRHHKNGQGGGCIAMHSWSCRMGLEYRVRIGGVDDLKEAVRALARREGKVVPQKHKVKAERRD